MAQKLSTVVGYLFALLPLYIFVLSPLQRTIYGPPEELDDDINDTVDTNVTSDFFILPDESLSCPTHLYDVHLLSSEPLIIYIPSFVSEAETEHIINISEDKFEPSTVWDGQVAHVDRDVRVSEVALLELDNVVQCLAERARKFQGWRPDVYIEKMRSQRYGPSGHYRNHYDWTGANKRADRVSTFMVYLEGNCTGGGTNFPRLKMPTDPKWCEFLDCEDSEHPGITFKPIRGNAVFWLNLRPDGTGYPETWHAALPVLSGTKIGLNVWSWYQRQGH